MNIDDKRLLQQQSMTIAPNNNDDCLIKINDYDYPPGKLT